MKNIKYRMEFFSFFDHVTIGAHLERMAEKGWMIEKVSGLGWKYRRIAPRKVKFAVSYYPKASEFDPEPSEEQKMFHEFCAHTGWKLACTSAQMQIFYNENENAIPIETEPKLELQAIHASTKKGMIPSYLLLLVVAIMNGCLFVSRLLGDPLSLLADASGLFSGLSCVILATLCLVELFVYFRWYKSAKIAAEQGEFLKAPSTANFQKAMLIIIGIAGVYWIFSSLFGASRLKQWIFILVCIYIPVLIIIVNGTKEFLKRKKVSRRMNFAITILVDFVFAFGLMGLITFGILKASDLGLFAESHELPLQIEDLVDVDYEGYIRERREDSSLLLSRTNMYQRPRFDAEDYNEIPQLEYTLVAVHVPALYDFCKDRLIYEKEHSHPVKDREYRNEDAASWGAEEVYRLYDLEYGARNTYLVCYEEVMVEITFDWEPTIEQRAIVAEKLNIASLR